MKARLSNTIIKRIARKVPLCIAWEGAAVLAINVRCEFMECPYCKGKMETGRILAGCGTSVYWLPNEACQRLNIMKSTRKGIEKVGGIVIAKETNNFSEPTTTYICKDCKKVILNI